MKIRILYYHAPVVGKMKYTIGQDEELPVAHSPFGESFPVLSKQFPASAPLPTPEGISSRQLRYVRNSFFFFKLLDCLVINLYEYVEKWFNFPLANYMAAFKLSKREISSDEKQASEQLTLTISEIIQSTQVDCKEFLDHPVTPYSYDNFLPDALAALRDTSDLVIIPPKVDTLTDIEESNENDILSIYMPTDIPADIEIM
nr:unnamed protein product [Callosobruchus analis]